MPQSLSIGPAVSAASGTSLPDYPVASNGKRNWSWSAVHGTQPVPSHETVPEYEGSFGDFLADVVDIVNPLQHIPVVSSVYRELTGDTIDGAGRILGGLLFGGPLGMVGGIGSTVMAQTTGGDFGTAALQALLSTSADSSTNMASLEVAPGFSRATEAYSRGAALGTR